MRNRFYYIATAFLLGALGLGVWISGILQRGQTTAAYNAPTPIEAPDNRVPMNPPDDSRDSEPPTVSAPTNDVTEEIDDAVARDLEERKAAAREHRRTLPPYRAGIPDRRKLRELARGAPIMAPEYAAPLVAEKVDGRQTAIVVSSPTRRRDGAPPGMTAEKRRREVWGRVLEIRGAELIPLANVLVFDKHDSRTFTDEDGCFRFSAYCTEQGRDAADMDDDQSNDSCVLGASAPGYLPALAVGPVELDEVSAWPKITSDELNSAEGARLYLVRVGNAPIRLRLTNPPTNVTDMTLWAGGFGTGASTFNYDVNYYVSGKADANGELLISVPPLTFGWFGAYGPGWRVPNASFNDLGWYDGVRTVELTLKPVENKPVRGVVHDLRSGAVLPGVRVSTYDDQSVVTFSDDRGAFELWVDPASDVSPNSNALVFSHPAYRGVSWRLDRLDPLPGDIAKVVRPNGGFEGVWTVSLRPFVAVTGRVKRTDGSPVNGGKLDIGLEAWPPGFVIGRDAIQVGEDGTFECPWFPWGLRNVKYAARQSPIYVDADVDAAVWNGEEPYELSVSLP